MTQDQVSPEEVEALLPSGAEPLPAADGTGADASGVRPYDLSSEERIIRGRLPAVEMVNERFARNFRDGAFQFMRRHPEISVGEVRLQKFSAFMREVPEPSNLNVMQVRPLRGTALIVCEPALVFTVIESLFGGTGKRTPPVAGREFSAMEQRIILRLVELVCGEYAKSWAPVHALTLEYVRSETQHQFAAVAAPTEIVVTTTFRIDFADGGGNLHICIPYSTFEPIRDALVAPPGDHGGVDRRWVQLLTQQIKAASVELSAELAHGEATVGELMALKVGDFIALDRDATLVSKIDGVPIFECDYGTLGSRYGIRIREFLTQAGDVAAASRS